jgi:hypothetical protein
VWLLDEENFNPVSAAEKFPEIDRSNTGYKTAGVMEDCGEVCACVMIFS